MNERDNIIDWVTQVDMAFLKRTEPWNMFDKYEAFADLIRADEREACAKFLECVDLGNLPPDLALHYGLLINSLVAGIRARGNT